MTIKLSVYKTNGLRGNYQQTYAPLENEFLKKLIPRELFTRGQMVFGTGNPYTILNPAQISYIAVESEEQLSHFFSPGIVNASLLPDRDAFMATLERRWKLWSKLHASTPSSPLEAFTHIEMTGGWELYAHVIGKFPDRKSSSKVATTLLDQPVICIQKNNGMIYVNPISVNRIRIYHSNLNPFKPDRTFPLDPEEI